MDKTWEQFLRILYKEMRESDILKLVDLISIHVM